MADNKKIKDKQRHKNKIRKAEKLVKDFFEEKKKETITYKCLVCGAEVEVPRLSIEMRIEKDEFGELDIPGYECEACDATMLPKDLEKLNLREINCEQAFEEFKNKKL